MKLGPDKFFVPRLPKTVRDNINWEIRGSTPKKFAYSLLATEGKSMQ